MNILNAVKSYILCYFSLSYLVFACESCKTNSKFDEGKTSSGSHKKKFIPNTEIDYTSFINDKQNKDLHEKLKNEFNGKINVNDIDDFLWDLMYSYDSGKRNVVKKDKYSNLEEVLQDVLGMKMKFDNNKKADEILDKIRTEFKNDLLLHVFPEDEVKKEIIELNFDENKVNGYIKECNLKIDNATKLFNKEDLNNTDLNDNVSQYYTFVRHIIDHNMTEDQVAELIKGYKNKPKQEKVEKKEYKNKPEPGPVQPVPAANLTPDQLNEKVNQIYQELEDEYGISGFIEEEAAKDEIRKLNCNRAAINEWIENALINGEQ